MGDVDFEGDIVAAVGHLVPADVEGWSAIGQMTADDAWLAYGNWLSRHVEPRPRTVHVSRELEQLLAGHPDEESVRTVLREVERGDDLTPRLSKGTVYLHEDKAVERGRARRRDLDLLLNDWGVHHLHLGAHTPNKRFVQRSKNLLLISFLDDHAYAVTLLAHGGWADETILSILADNWPKDGVLLGPLSGIGLAERIPPESRLDLRNAGVSTMYEHHDGRIYVPRGMMSTAGTSITLGLQKALECSSSAESNKHSRTRLKAASTLWSAPAQTRRPAARTGTSRCSLNTISGGCVTGSPEQSSHWASSSGLSRTTQPITRAGTAQHPIERCAAGFPGWGRPCGAPGDLASYRRLTRSNGPYERLQPDTPC